MVNFIICREFNFRLESFANTQLGKIMRTLGLKCSFSFGSVSKLDERTFSTTLNFDFIKAL